MKRFLITSATVLAFALAMTSCKKKCSDCPDGMHLSVDEPKEKSCIFCPTGEDYDAALGYCN